MNTILFECDVTEFDITPKKDNDEICFALNKKAMVINFMNTQEDSILMQSEIEKEDAIRLAKLILFNYDIKIPINE